MVQVQDPIHAEHGKHVSETNEDRIVSGQQSEDYDHDAEHGSSGLQAPVEYDDKAIERVYRKLDLRIIPGMHIHPFFKA
jgi:hypothetical protein